jgi:hypothetical protein
MSTASANYPRRPSGLAAISFNDIRQLLAEQPAGPASHPPTSGGGGGVSGPSGPSGPPSPRPSEQGALSRDSSRVLHSLSSLRGPPLSARGAASPAASPPVSRTPSRTPAHFARPPSLQRYLDMRCRKVLQILERAQQPRFSLSKGGYAKPLPPAVVRCCKVGVGSALGWWWGPSPLACRTQAGLHAHRRQHMLACVLVERAPPAHAALRGWPSSRSGRRGCWPAGTGARGW